MIYKTENIEITINNEYLKLKALNNNIKYIENDMIDILLKNDYFFSWYLDNFIYIINDSNLYELKNEDNYIFDSSDLMKLLLKKDIIFNKKNEKESIEILKLI